nr:hypothetical protein Iba_chr11aCG18960 [Ipomoea batatas]
MADWVKGKAEVRSNRLRTEEPLARGRKHLVAENRKERWRCIGVEENGKHHLPVLPCTAVEEKTDTETYRLEVAYQRSNSVRRRMAEEDESEGKSLIVADIRRRQWERGKSESEARSIGYNGDIGVYGRALSICR